MSTSHVLITGGTGYVATHIIDQLIKIGGYKIVATTRDAVKAQSLYTTFPHYKDVVTFVSVPDFTNPEAFTQVFKEASPPFDYVLHTASPLPIPSPDVYKDIIAPGPEGVLALFQAAKKYGTDSLKRIVLTSSGVTMLDPFIKPGAPRVFTEDDWSPVTEEQAISTSNPGLAYFVSKTSAEKSAFKFIETESPQFDLVVINPVIVLGPNLNPVTSSENIEQGVKRHIYSFIDGTYPQLSDAKFDFYSHIDVRDVARAHIDALTNQQASGKRITTSTSDPLTPQSVINIIKKRFPELEGRLTKGGDEANIEPEGVVRDRFPSTRVKDFFGWDYIPFEQTVVDSVNQLLEVEKAWRK